VVATGEQRVQLSGDLQRATDESIAEIDSVLAALAAAADPRFEQVVHRAQNRLQFLRDDLHALTSGLGPLTLATGDLPAAIRELLSGVDLPSSTEIDPVDVGSDVATALYFVCGEAVSNAIKHSRASRLTVKLCAFDGSVHLEIADDGVGGADCRHGSGLRGLADRVGAFDGTLNVVSRAGEGTTVRVTIPVSPVLRRP
jgi:signal transduction histidine kinase